MLILIFLSALLIFALAYRFYGRFLEKQYGIDDSRKTPAHTDYDGVDRVPAHAAILLGHHFSSIAGAGPIVGPIIAALAFGWAPALLWILLGAILIGGVHDFSALVASIRHKARSIAEIAKEYVSPLAYKLFLTFIWLCLVYVITVFTDLTSATFVGDGGVATSSLLFMVLAIGFGLSVYRFKLPVWLASLIFVPMVFVVVWLGQQIPIRAEQMPLCFGNDPAKTWDLILLCYCFVASVTPVWILLQPRDYLSSYLLYASVLGGLVGILGGGFVLQYPAFIAWSNPKIGALVPMLFITVACGACSGFHSVVASGTSSKQISKESDARVVGYGGMLIEGLVAVIALTTVIMLSTGDPLTKKTPLEVYGSGMSRFLSVVGIPANIGFSFGLLALSTFILTTLDTTTRLGRYIVEEFFNCRGKAARYVATLATLAAPAVLVLITLKDAQGNPIPAWKIIWPVFGATNQLLAGLALLVIVMWLKKSGRNVFFALLPMIFMVVMTVWSLVLLLGQYGLSVIGIIAGVLLALAVLVIMESIRTYRKGADQLHGHRV
jgi:carbon starvation protein